MPGAAIVTVPCRLYTSDFAALPRGIRTVQALCSMAAIVHRVTFWCFDAQRFDQIISSSQRTFANLRTMSIQNSSCDCDTHIVVDFVSPKA